MKSKLKPPSNDCQDGRDDRITEWRLNQEISYAPESPQVTANEQAMTTALSFLSLFLAQPEVSAGNLGWIEAGFKIQD